MMNRDTTDLIADTAELLTRIGSGHTPTRGEEAILLARWRQETLSAPIPELVDPDTAAVVIRAGRDEYDRRSRSRVSDFVRRCLTRHRDPHQKF